jgi:hypothetical protein
MIRTGTMSSEGGSVLHASVAVITRHPRQVQQRFVLYQT